MAMFYSLLLAFGFLSQASAQHGDYSGGQPGGDYHRGGGDFTGAPGGGPIDFPHDPGFGGRPEAGPPTGPWRGNGYTASPKYNYIFQFPLPIPPVAEPEYSETIDGRTIDYYSMEIKPFKQQIYPDLEPANLIGYNGIAPGPTYVVERYHETVVRCLNNGEQVSSLHLHGSYTHAPWDGWGEDTIPVGSYKDYYYPNSEAARSLWYHDHASGVTAGNAYFGQAGLYIMHDPEEDSHGLPKGDYEVALAISDKIYQSNGDLKSPEGEHENFYGDIIHVNDQPWPYLEVEPRKYRLRYYCMSLSRAYDLYLETEDGSLIEHQVIASDSGLFQSPVTTSDVVIAPGERYEVIVDFGDYKGQNITLKNGLEIANVNDFENTDKVMLFVVGNSVNDDGNNGDVPTTLNSVVQWPTPKETVDRTFNFQGGNGGEWTINGVTFADPNNRVLAKPPQGTVERWQFVFDSAPTTHPVHLHMVNLQVISRTGSARTVLPYEAMGLKDVVLLQPGETVDVLAYYGPWDGVFMFHCHNLIHEDHEMMAAFNITLLEELGYDNDKTIGFADPMDPRFAPKKYNAKDFEPDAIKSAVHSLASLKAYPDAASIMADQYEYYATAGSNGDGWSAEATPAGNAKKRDHTTTQGVPAVTPPPTRNARRSRRRTT